MVSAAALRKMRACKALMASANEGEAAAATAAFDRLVAKHGRPPEQIAAVEHEQAPAKAEPAPNMSWDEAERFAERFWDRSRQPREHRLTDDEIERLNAAMFAEQAEEFARNFGTMGTGESWGA